MAKSRFTVLKHNQNYMARLGLYSYRLHEKTNEYAKTFAAYFIQLSMLMAMFVSALFIYVYVSVELKASLGAFKIIIGTGQCAGTFFCLGMKLSKIKALHNKLQELVDTCKWLWLECSPILLKFCCFKPPSKLGEEGEVYDLYWKNELKCRKYTIRIGAYVLCHTGEFAIVLTFALICLATGNYDTSRWILFFNMVTPFDRTKVSGWFGVWAMQSSIAISYSVGMTAATSYFVSCCFYISTMCKHFELIMRRIKEDLNRIQAVTNLHKLEQNRLKTKRQLKEAVILHMKIFE